jgi:DNA polymerase (family 10)
MPAIPPELREGRDEIPRALAGTLPKLVTDDDIAGILHAHTDRSDGVDKLETMAEATLSRGYEYFGVADHSKSAHYAGGLTMEEGYRTAGGGRCPEQEIRRAFPHLQRH